MKVRNYNLGYYNVPAETKEGICLEIGANVGSFTEKYRNHFKLIHYYEPLTECFDIIQGKTTSNNHIVGRNLAGYSRSGEVMEMRLHSNKDSGSTGLNTETLNSEWTETVVQKVETISLEDMIKNLGVDYIDYCKSDCETGEYHIFLNKDLSKLKYIGIEIHHQMGKEKWDTLCNYLLQTHTLVNGTIEFQNKNKEVLFKLR